MAWSVLFRVVFENVKTYTVKPGHCCIGGMPGRGQFF